MRLPADEGGIMFLIWGGQDAEVHQEVARLHAKRKKTIWKGITGEQSTRGSSAVGEMFGLHRVVEIISMGSSRLEQLTCT